MTLKLPEFRPTDSECWFIYIEALLRVKRITARKTEYDYVVPALPQYTAAIVRDVLRAPPQDVSYDALKIELIRRSTASEQRSLQLLLTEYRNTPDLLWKMQQLLEDKADTLDLSIFRELFPQRLPHQVTISLSTARDCTLDALARLADKIKEVGTPALFAAHRCSCPTPVSFYSELAALSEVVHRLCAKVEQLSTEAYVLPQSGCCPSRRRQRWSSNGRRSTRSYSASPPAYQLCWYYWKFGERANNCGEPCSSTGNDSTTH